MPPRAPPCGGNVQETHALRRLAPCAASFVLKNFIMKICIALALVAAASASPTCLRGDMSDSNGQALMAYWSNWPQYRIKGNTFPQSKCPPLNNPNGPQRADARRTVGRAE